VASHERTLRTRLRNALRRRRTTTVAIGEEPWWVRLLRDWGRPAITVLVLVICAPGEHQLAVMAGWSYRLAWGVPVVFAAYAGISAVVAVRRPKGAPGRGTANIGSLLAIGIAMAVQPIAHLYVRGVWTPNPHDTVWLIVGVSCVPSAVLAHLLHLAAQPTHRTEHPEQAPDQPVHHDEQPDEQPVYVDDQPSPHGLINLPNDLITTEQAMTILGVSRATFGRYTRAELITCAHIDATGRKHYSRADVENHKRTA